MKTTASSFSSLLSRSPRSTGSVHPPWGPAFPGAQPGELSPLRTKGHYKHHHLLLPGLGTLTPVSINEEQSVCVNLCPLRIMHHVSVYILHFYLHACTHTCLF